MNKMFSTYNKERLLFIPQVLTFAGVAIAGVLDMDTPAARIETAGLLAVYAFFLFTPVFWHGQMWVKHLCLGILTILIAILIYLGNGMSYFPILFFLLSPLAMIHLSTRDGLIWIGIFTVISCIVLWISKGVIGIVATLPFSAGYAFFGISGWVMAEADRDRIRAERLLQELQMAHQQLQDYAARVEELAVVQERNRIAREVHDSLGHRLTVAAVTLEGAQRLVRTNPDRAEKMIGIVREQVRDGLADLRRTVAMLRASVDEDLPLTEAITRLARQFEEATGLKINLALQNSTENLPVSYRQTFYRCVQEGLTNIQRHSQASEAWIQFDLLDNRYTLHIGDNGVGMPEASNLSVGDHFGLVGLKEKAALLGGDFFIDPRPNGGTQITISLPVQEEQNHEYSS